MPAFFKEALMPLSESLKLAIHSFAWLVGEYEKEINQQLTTDFIKDNLIDKHQLPPKTISLFGGIKVDITQDVIKSFLIEHQEISSYIKQRLEINDTP
jgi:hypothetical protein